MKLFYKIYHEFFPFTSANQPYLNSFLADHLVNVQPRWLSSVLLVQDKLKLLNNKLKSQNHHIPEYRNCAPRSGLLEQVLMNQYTSQRLTHPSSCRPSSPSTHPREKHFSSSLFKPVQVLSFHTFPSYSSSL